MMPKVETRVSNLSVKVISLAFSAALYLCFTGDIKGQQINLSSPDGLIRYNFKLNHGAMEYGVPITAPTRVSDGSELVPRWLVSGRWHSVMLYGLIAGEER